MITQQSGDALGSKVLFTLRTANAQDANDILAKIRIFLGDFEARFSRFLPDSELTRVNKKAGEWTIVSDEFIRLAKQAQIMQRETDGLYNPLLLAQLQAAGYLKSWTGSPRANAVTAPDFSNRVLSDTLQASFELRQNSIRIPATSALDFGGIGKGYALDCIAEIIEANGCTNYWISLGGDILSSGTQELELPWLVELGALHEGGSDTDDVPILSPMYEMPHERRAIATSSILKRQGKDWHHLIDPRTGKPANTSVLSAVVIANSGVTADVMAKCLIIASKEVKSFWRKHTQIDAYAQYRTHYERLHV